MIEQFLSYLRYERNRSPLTVLNYGRDLKDFESYLKTFDEHLSVETADADLIRGWMESMVDKGNSASSVNRRLSAVRAFFHFALLRNLVSRDPSYSIRGPKAVKPLPQFVREKDMDALLDNVEEGDSYKEVLARTILMMFYETGVRVAELVALDDESVDSANRVVRVVGKGRKERVVPFGEELAGTLVYYRAKRDADVKRTSRALFVTAKGERMNTDQVRYMVKKKLSIVSSLKKRSPHVLRHTFATAMLNHGASIESIRKLLGHAKIDTTEVYAHTTFEQLKREYKQAHPRA